LPARKASSAFPAVWRIAMSRYAQIVRNLTPPVIWNFGKQRLPWLVRALGGHFTHSRFTGDYASWDDARSDATGYDAPAILENTRDAVLKVKRGQNRWEQDGMVSDSDAMPWTLLAALARIASTKGKPELNVIDFGGSLGSIYYRCRTFFNCNFKLTWNVVEQPEHVKIGKIDFQDNELHFYFTVEEALAQQPADVLLLSSVIQYLNAPEAWLENLRRWPIPYLILDRTPLTENNRHRLTVQHVPKEIYEASYPAWLLSKQKILSLIERDYRLMWKAPDTEAWTIGNETIQNSLWFFERCKR
jgi:putative methyltransferase (TIGR04325 family)